MSDNNIENVPEEIKASLIILFTFNKLNVVKIRFSYYESAEISIIELLMNYNCAFAESGKPGKA